MVAAELRIPISVSRRTSAAGQWLRIELPAEIEEWTLGLCLLAAELVEEVRIISLSDDLTIAVDARLKPADRGRAVLGEKSVKIMLSRTELEAWQYFFLRAFRDGEPEVDHIDVELRTANRASVDLTVKVQNAKPPMSGTDAARLLLGDTS